MCAGYIYSLADKIRVRGQHFNREVCTAETWHLPSGLSPCLVKNLVAPIFYSATQPVPLPYLKRSRQVVPRFQVYLGMQGLH